MKLNNCKKECQKKSQLRSNAKCILERPFSIFLKKCKNLFDNSIKCNKNVWFSDAASKITYNKNAKILQVCRFMLYFICKILYNYFC